MAMEAQKGMSFTCVYGAGMNIKKDRTYRSFRTLFLVFIALLLVFRSGYLRSHSTLPKHIYISSLVDFPPLSLSRA